MVTFLLLIDFYVFIFTSISLIQTLAIGVEVQMEEETSSPFIYFKPSNVVTENPKIDAYLWLLKRIFNFTIWQYPMIFILWPQGED
mmetsp:Transcript_16431/g.27856  ORF Transcript_16431/g.27856 Transcript_16431/m.27856 type:complete len:86 (+) Transcript_16431:759-1016(+)